MFSQVLRAQGYQLLNQLEMNGLPSSCNRFYCYNIANKIAAACHTYTSDPLKIKASLGATQSSCLSEDWSEQVFSVISRLHAAAHLLTGRLVARRGRQMAWLCLDLKVLVHLPTPEDFESMVGWGGDVGSKARCFRHYCETSLLSVSLLERRSCSRMRSMWGSVIALSETLRMFECWIKMISD